MYSLHKKIPFFDHFENYYNIFSQLWYTPSIWPTVGGGEGGSDTWGKVSCFIRGRSHMILATKGCLVRLEVRGRSNNLQATRPEGDGSSLRSCGFSVGTLMNMETTPGICYPLGIVRPLR